MEKIYIAYDNDDLPIYVGNGREMSKFLGYKTLACFHCMMSRKQKPRACKEVVMVVME